jgi:hypothetical protein
MTCKVTHAMSLFLESQLTPTIRPYSSRLLQNDRMPS